jgi:hypothetical protein
VYTLRVDSINGGNDRIDYSIEVRLPSFQSECLQAWQPRTGLSPCDSITTYGA